MQGMASPWMREGKLVTFEEFQEQEQSTLFQLCSTTPFSWNGPAPEGALGYLGDEDYSPAGDENLSPVSPNVLYDRCMLKIIAPKGPTEQRDISLEDDILARESQFQHFCDLYPGFSEEPRRNTGPEPIIVYNFSDPPSGSLAEHIDSFFMENAPKSEKVIVVFNGHGTPQGMLLEKEDDPIPVDTFIEKVKGCYYQHMTYIGGERFPKALDIVLAQCFSHVNTSEDEEDIRIISFTTKDNPFTIFTLKRDPISSKNIHLNRHAREEQKRVDSEMENE